MSCPIDPYGTRRAREVLSRCAYFAGTIREDGLSGRAWEAQFSAAVALLRSVGHALDKKNTEGWWEALRSDKRSAPIFWEFVHKERNLVLKEANLRAGQSVGPTVPGVQADARVAGEQKPSPLPLPARATPAYYSYHMNEGAFKGRDPRDLIDEAIIWWKEQLLKIDGGD